MVSIRKAVKDDLDAVIALDKLSTGAAKPDYWQGIFTLYLSGSKKDRVFLVAETADFMAGFILGEVRAWEFGSPPCGWVTALTVSPRAREMGIGKQMFEDISLRLKQEGVSTVRTMVDRDDKLTLSFFRSLGMRTGRYIELETGLD
jgi:ribosomal protein S18 acetylase RimI-like enzyme